MNKDEMVEGIMRACGINKTNVNRFYEGLVELAKKKLSTEGQFILPGLGVLRVKVAQERYGRHPRTGERIRIPRKRVVRFGAFKDLKEILNAVEGELIPDDTEPSDRDPSC